MKTSQIFWRRGHRKTAFWLMATALLFARPSQAELKGSPVSELKTTPWAVRRATPKTAETLFLGVARLTNSQTLILIHIFAVEPKKGRKWFSTLQIFEFVKTREIASWKMRAAFPLTAATHSNLKNLSWPSIPFYVRIFFLQPSVGTGRVISIYSYNSSGMGGSGFTLLAAFPENWRDKPIFQIFPSYYVTLRESLGTFYNTDAKGFLQVNQHLQGSHDGEVDPPIRNVRPWIWNGNGWTGEPF